MTDTDVHFRPTAGGGGPGFDWLLNDFVRDTDGVRDAVVVSMDGLLIARSAGLPRDEGDHLAALVCGLVSLARGAARRYDFGGMKILMIEMRRGYLLVSAITDGGCIGVLAGEGADLGVIGYAMAVLADRAGEVLTPAVIAELREALAA
jgi:predicted regulator of Ras-like GTPase activity (Roadblock/LC7/MglB family)